MAGLLLNKQANVTFSQVDPSFKLAVVIFWLQKRVVLRDKLQHCSSASRRDSWLPIVAE